MNKKIINLYIDELGNTGEIKLENKNFNFGENKDSYFSNCLLLITKLENTLFYYL